MMLYQSFSVSFFWALVLTSLVSGDSTNTCEAKTSKGVPPNFQVLPGVRIRACQEAGHDYCSIHELNALSESNCWKLCESLTSCCRLFAYNAKLGHCYIYDQDFYTSWTSVDVSNGNWTTYYKQRDDGWKLLYKMSKGITIDAIDAYTTIPGHSFVSQSLLEKDASCGCYVKSQIVDNWSKFQITQVSVSLAAAGSHVKQVTFSSVGETSTSFFKQSNIVSSSWTDLTAWSSVWFMSLNQQKHSRGYLIVKSPFAGCSSDLGWLSVFVHGGPGFSNDVAPASSFAYSRGPNADYLFNNASFADALMVYAKM